MWSTGIRVWGPCLLACVVACGAKATLDRAQTGPAAGRAAPPIAGSKGSGPTGGKLSTDNPDGVIPTLPDNPAVVPVTMNDEDAGTCKEGKFCQPKGPDGDCGSERVDTDLKQVQKPGNVLVIYDRSGSMDADWNGTPKYQAAGNA